MQQLVLRNSRLQILAKFIGLCFLLIVVLLALGTVAVDLLLVRPFVSDIEAKLAALTSTERHLPDNLLTTTRLIQPRACHWLARRLLVDLENSPASYVEWHAISLIWASLLPLHFSDEELLALYWSYLPTDEEGGWTRSAELLFGKEPSSLTPADVTWLLTTARLPSGRRRGTTDVFILGDDPDSLARNRQRLFARLCSQVLSKVECEEFAQPANQHIWTPPVKGEDG